MLIQGLDLGLELGVGLGEGLGPGVGGRVALWGVGEAGVGGVKHMEWRWLWVNSRPWEWS